MIYDIWYKLQVNQVTNKISFWFQKKGGIPLVVRCEQLDEASWQRDHYVTSKNGQSNSEHGEMEVRWSNNQEIQEWYYFNPV